MELVISHFNEELNLLDYDIFPELRVYDKITIYTKGDMKIEKLNVDKYEVIYLENVGMCDQSYMYHIYKNYENLKDVITFIPASFLSSSIKLLKLFRTVKKTIETKKSVFYFTERTDLKTLEFVLDEWKLTDPRNREKNDCSDYQTHHTRPFCKWYTETINEEYDKINYCGIFSVSKEDIYNRSRDFYEKLLKEFKYKNSEYAHYIERSWMSIFKIKDENAYSHNLDEARIFNFRYTVLIHINTSKESLFAQLRYLVMTLFLNSDFK